MKSMQRLLSSVVVLLLLLTLAAGCADTTPESSAPEVTSDGVENDGASDTTPADPEDSAVSETPAASLPETDTPDDSSLPGEGETAESTAGGSPVGSTTGNGSGSTAGNTAGSVPNVTTAGGHTTDSGATSTAPVGGTTAGQPSQEATNSTTKATTTVAGATTTTRRVSRTTKKPPREDALNLLPATGSSAASLNVERIRYCLINYGFCYLAGGERFDLGSPLDLGMDNAILGCADEKDPAELRLTTKAWHLLLVTGTNVTVQDLTINYNGQYGSGAALDKAVVQLYGQSTVIDNCTIQGNVNPERNNDNTIVGLYFLSEKAKGSTVKNSTIKNCFYGVIFRDVLTKSQNNQLLNCTVTYNRCDGVTFAGYGVVRDCTITYNGYDCRNPYGDSEYPIPGAGVYTENTNKGFVVDGCEIAYNNGFNLDINVAENLEITNNNIHDPGWRQFPKAADYKTVNYGNGISACLTGMRNSVFTGNTITNNVAANRLDQSYAHLYTGGDVNDYFQKSGSSTPFSGLTPGGASVVACALVNYPGRDQNYGNTISNNTFTAKTSDSATTGIGLVVNYKAHSKNTFSKNTDSGSEIGTVYFD